MMQRPAISPAPPPIASASDAQALVSSLMDLMDVMLRAIEEETVLVRAGHLKDAARLDPVKNELARQYLAESNRLKANAGALTRHVPQLVDALRKRHETFQAVLQMNLTVLATAHAVAEGLIRGAAAEAAKEAAPQTYGKTGYANAPARHAHMPVAINRTT
jgi:hypothetical protein